MSHFPKTALSLIGCLLATLSLIAAENPAAQSGLSMTTTESYQIRNHKFGDLLRPEGANGADGTSIVLYSAEPWKCMTWKLHPAGGTGFHVQNHFTGKTFVVNATPGGTNVIQVKLVRVQEEQPVWVFEKLPDGFYKIRAAKSGGVLTAIETVGQSVHIVMAPWQDRDEQKWQLEKIDPATLTM